MTVEECTKLMINALKEGHLSTADIVDKYCEWTSPRIKKFINLRFRVCKTFI